MTDQTRPQSRIVDPQGFKQTPEYQAAQHDYKHPQGLPFTRERADNRAAAEKRMSDIQTEWTLADIRAMRAERKAQQAEKYPDPNEIWATRDETSDDVMISPVGSHLVSVKTLLADADHDEHIGYRVHVDSFNVDGDHLVGFILGEYAATDLRDNLNSALQAITNDRARRAE